MARIPPFAVWKVLAGSMEAMTNAEQTCSNAHSSNVLGMKDAQTCEDDDDGEQQDSPRNIGECVPTLFPLGHLVSYRLAATHGTP